VGGRTLALEHDVLKLSERGDVSLIRVGEREAELSLLDSESGQSLNVTLLYFGDAWHRARIGLVEWVEGSWRKAPNQIQHTRRGLQIGRVRPGIVYRLFLPQE
jgi:hypothetical protein